MSLINATVSHEMRTPINSITSQNINLKHLVEKLGESLADSLSIEALQSKVRRLKDELGECCTILDSSSRFLAYEVNDMLDFS